MEEAETDLWTSGKLGGDSLQGEKWAGGTEAGGGMLGTLAVAGKFSGELRLRRVIQEAWTQIPGEQISSQPLST